MNRQQQEPLKLEPWLRGTLTEVDAVQRAVLHALELAAEDLQQWCGELNDHELNARPYDLAPVAFHIRHIARSLDRLLTYAEGRQLDGEQISTMKTELDAAATQEELFMELRGALERSGQRVRAFSPSDYNAFRGVGRKQMPTTAGGLLVHCADHTQRHVGQAVTTAKVVMAMRESQ